MSARSLLTVMDLLFGLRSSLVAKHMSARSLLSVMDLFLGRLRSSLVKDMSARSLLSVLGLNLLPPGEKQRPLGP